MAEYTIDKIEYGGNVYKLQDNVSGYTANTGTVTSVGISNATNGGLSISGSPITSSGTISVGHSNVLSSAQTTQAVYPIKIDKNGHISAYGSAVTIPTIPSNNVTGSGSTDYLARWSGTNTLSSTSLSISTSYNSSSDEYGTIKLYVGSTGQINWKGQLVFYEGNSSKTVTITPPTLTASRTITLPDKTGTIALTSDLPTVPTNIVNTITTTAGTHTAITSQKGNVSFNVPTKTSHLTNDSGFITSAGVTSITTTAGAHTVITSSTGAVSFKVPTKTSHLTNDSGFITTDTNTTYALSGALSSHKFTSTLTAGGSGSGTSTSDFTLAAGTGITITDDTSARKMTIACSVTNTDRKLEIGAVTSATTYYPIVGANSTTAATRQFDTTGFKYYPKDGTTSTVGTAELTLGNSTASGTAGNKQGTLKIYGSTAYAHTIQGAPTAARTLTLPNNSGTIALTSDLSSYVQKPSENGTSGWILKTRGNNNTYWDAPNVYQFGIYEDTDNPGTYSYYGGDIEDYIRSAFESGQNLALQLDLLNSINELDTYMLTDYHAEWVNANGGGYVVLWFTGIFKTGIGQKKITVGVYLDYYQIEHEYGEIAVNIKTINDTIDTAMSSTSTNPVQNKVILAAINAAASAGSSGAVGMTIDGWKICWGSVTLATTSASGSGTFASPYYISSSKITLSYSSVPYIWCQVVGEWTGIRYATPYDISETGFKVRLYASSKNSTNTQIRWLSIGKA